MEFVELVAVKVNGQVYPTPKVVSMNKTHLDVVGVEGGLTKINYLNGGVPISYEVAETPTYIQAAIDPTSANLYSGGQAILAQTATPAAAQGSGPITAYLNQYTVAAAATAGCTLPTAVAGLVVAIVVDAAVVAATIKVFPASGDTISGGTVDVNVTQAKGTIRWYYAENATNWKVLSL